MRFLSVLFFVVAMLMATATTRASVTCLALLQAKYPEHYKIANWFAENYPPEVLSVALENGGDSFSGQYNAGDFIVHDTLRGAHPIYRMEGTSFKLVSYPNNKTLTAAEFKVYLDGAADRRGQADKVKYPIPEALPESVFSAP